MKTQAILNVKLAKEIAGAPRNNPIINDENLFKRLLLLGPDSYWHRPNDSGQTGSATFKFPAESDALKKLVESLKNEAGLTPLETGFVPHDMMDRHYQIKYDRSYTKKDLDAASLLYINPKHVTLATMGDVEELENWSVKADKNQKNEKSFGKLWPLWVYGFAEPLKTQLEESGLKCLKFESIPVLPEKKAIKPIWKLTSSVTMPDCLLPTVRGNGLPFNGDFNYGCYYDDRGYSPVELRYKSMDVRALGEFDVAVTKECLSAGGHLVRREVVVSQKFRQIVEALKVPGMDFVPVRLET